MSDVEVHLDTPQGCVIELTRLNQDVADFADLWWKAASELKTDEKRWDRLYKAAMRGTSGRNADERAAVAQAAVESVEGAEGLAEDIERLVGEVEGYKRRFDTIERRSSNAQSILKSHREADRFDDFIPREARQMTGGFA